MKDIEIDKRTLAYGPVAKYYSKTLLDQHIEWYINRNYKLYRLDASKWSTIDDCYSDIHNTFSFPSYFGRNWDAVDDCFIDIETGIDGNVVVCINNFDLWKKEDSKNALIFLDILSDQTYKYLVSGKKFITLIQCNDPKFEIRKIGAKYVHWVWEEWNERN